MRVFSKAAPTVAVAKAGMQASDSLRKLIHRAQTTADEMDRQGEANNAEIMAMADEFEKKLAAEGKKPKPVAADRGHGASTSGTAPAKRGRRSTGAARAGAPAPGKSEAARAGGRSSKCDGAGRDTSGNPD